MNINYIKLLVTFCTSLFILFYFYKVKIIVIHLLIFLLGFRPAIPFIEYTIDYEYIATVLCINKNKPKMQCNGKCYLKKQLAKSIENESSQQEKKNKNTSPKLLDDFFFSPIIFYTQKIALQKLEANKTILQPNNYIFNLEVSILKPPIV